MNKFFQDEEVASSIKLKLFCDESASPDKGWLYFAILFVPEQIEPLLLQNLLNSRCDNNERIGDWGECKTQCKNHNRNNTEIHFNEIKKSEGDKYSVANRWIDYYLVEVDNIFLYVFGIDLVKLDTNYFGNSRVEDNIYNRFFRTAILRASKSFFGKYKNITITDIIHDSSSSKESHYYFDWHSIFYINQNDPQINIVANNIEFINSDHRQVDGHNSYSHFLQFTDLILGCTRNCLDYTSTNDLKLKISLKALELVKRLIEAPNNINSSYKYVNRLKVDFFPKNDISRLDKDSLLYGLKRWDSFYTKRELAIISRHQSQLF